MTCIEEAKKDLRADLRPEPVSLPESIDAYDTMQDFKPLDGTEMAAVSKVCDIFKSLDLIPCTSCRYCVEENECPRGICITDLFSALNAHEAFHNWNTGYVYYAGMNGNLICDGIM